MDARAVVIGLLASVPFAAQAQTAPRYLITDMGGSRNGLLLASESVTTHPIIKADPATASMLGFKVAADIAGIAGGAINSRGEVTGTDFTGAFVYSKGTLEYFSTQALGADINARGQVTGC